jgi:hypothetical protein
MQVPHIKMKNGVLEVTYSENDIKPTLTNLTRTSTNSIVLETIQE